MVNQTTEILIGISNQTGMQLNELINYMASYQYTSSLLCLILCFVFGGVMVGVNYWMYKKYNEKCNADGWFDKEEYMFAVLIINGICIMIMLVVSHFIMDSVLGMMYPKQKFITTIINGLLY